MDKQSKALPGLYIHIPFCLWKCPYCDFYSCTDRELTSAWLEALEREMLFYKESFGYFDTLYLGGGTPTVLSEHEITRLIATVHRHFSFSDDAELTIEANPADLTPAKAGLLNELGFTRISLGVQSFDDRVLNVLQRRHSAFEACKAIELIRAAGFQNLSIDLMYAVPGQDTCSWTTTLQQALQYRPEHLSCYQLTIKQDTPFGHMKENGWIPELDEAVEESFFLTTTDVLTAGGYIQYEISSFARDEKYYSAHNRKYWQHSAYLGLGPAAHSFSGRRRWWNHASVTTYIQRLTQGTKPVKASETITDEQIRLEALFLNLRTSSGMDLATLQTYTGAHEMLPHLIRSNLVEINGCRIRPTTRGLMRADSLPILFV